MAPGTGAVGGVGFTLLTRHAAWSSSPPRAPISRSTSARYKALPYGISRYPNTQAAIQGDIAQGYSLKYAETSIAPRQARFPDPKAALGPRGQAPLQRRQPPRQGNQALIYRAKHIARHVLSGDDPGGHLHGCWPAKARALLRHW